MTKARQKKAPTPTTITLDSHKYESLAARLFYREGVASTVAKIIKNMEDDAHHAERSAWDEIAELFGFKDQFAVRLAGKQMMFNYDGTVELRDKKPDTQPDR